MNAKKKAKSAIIFLTVLSFFMGVGVLYMSYRTIPRGVDSYFWKKTSGIITKSKIDTSYSGKGNNYYLEIMYEYTHDGQVYVGDDFGAMSSGSNDSKETQKLHDYYAEGTKVDVFYNPKEVEDSMLVPGVLWSSWLFFIIGLVLFLTAIYSVFLSFSGKVLPFFRKYVE